MAVFNMGKLILVVVFLCVVAIIPVQAIPFTVDSNCDVHSFETSFDNTNRTWQGVCDGIEISGDYICSSMGGGAGDTSVDAPPIDMSDNRASINRNCWCKMTSPYVGYYWVFTGYSTQVGYGYEEPYCHGELGAVANSCSWRCARLWNQTTSGHNMEYGHYGYYTDDNLIKVKRGLFANAVLETPCEIGISKLMLSTGDGFTLWAEKYTEPSIVVRYNNQKCYVKLEQGAGRLNVKYNGAVYHATD